MKPSLAIVFPILLLSLLSISGAMFAQQQNEVQQISPDQQKRMELMKTKGPEASLTVLPVNLGGRPFERVSEIVALLLERQGLTNIELGKTPFDAGSAIDMAKLSGAFSDFVKKNPIGTDYALYTEYNATPQEGLVEMRSVVVDKTGEVVWTDRQGKEDEAIKQMQQKEPLTFSVLLVQRLGPQMGLSEETAKAAQPGKFARLMEERSGLPPESERVALPERLKALRESRKTMTLAIYPARIGDAADPASATELARMINDAGLCKAIPVKEPLLLKATRSDPNELKALWDLAREFREYARAHQPDADYALYPDYAFNPENWQQGGVHFVVCDRKGEWVAVDMQNSHQGDYQAIKPASVEGCSKLVVKRLGSYVKWSISDVLREKVGTSGIASAVSAFDELRAKKDEYSVSEEELNFLGYEYLQAKRYKEAIEIFKLNVREFPGSFNVYDSLGEAYAAAGEKDQAIKNYKKSLELNPNSQGGIEALKKLSAQ